MSEFTIISDDVRTVDASVADGRILVDPAQLPALLGWELKPEGLCRDDVCVPVRDQPTLFSGEQLDLERVTDALGRASVVDTDARIVSIALPAEERRRALDSLVAPSFELSDLHGGRHRLEEWHRRKRLLVAFASW
jgi:hypothetical protein